MITGFNRNVTTARRVKAFMAVYGFTYESIAENLGKSKQAVNQSIMNNRFTMDDIVNLQRLFGCSFDVLIQPSQLEDNEWMNAPMGRIGEPTHE